MGTLAIEQVDEVIGDLVSDRALMCRAQLYAHEILISEAEHARLGAHIREYVTRSIEIETAIVAQIERLPAA